MISTSDPADEDVLEIVRDNMRGVDLHIPLDGVVRRGRQLRRRRTARRRAAAVASAAALLAAAVVATNLPGHGQTLTSSGHRVDVDLVGWSVHTSAHSTVTLTLRETELREPARLRAILAEAGVAADIEVVPAKWTDDGTTVTIYGCEATPDRNALPQGGDVLTFRQVDGALTITIDPTRMPPGSVVDFVFLSFTEYPPSLPTPTHQPSPASMALRQGTAPPCTITTPAQSSRASVLWRIWRITPDDRIGTRPSPR